MIEAPWIEVKWLIQLLRLLWIEAILESETSLAPPRRCLKRIYIMKLLNSMHVKLGRLLHFCTARTHLFLTDLFPKRRKFRK